MQLITTRAAQEHRATIDELTGLRFVAALIVVLSHLPALIPFDGASDTLVRQAPGGVTTFFVLSGVVLTYNYRAQFAESLGGVVAFFRARLARIVPVSLLAMLLVMPLTVTDENFRASSTTAVSWVANVGLVHAFIPAHALHLWNIPSWSVSAELFFYAIFPLFIFLVVARLRSSRSLVALALGLVVVSAGLYGIVASFTARSLERSGKDPETISLMLERIKFFPPLRIWEFFLGCLVGEALVRRKRTAPRHGPLATGRRRHLVLAVALAGYVIAPVISTQFASDEPGLAAHLFTSGVYAWYAPFAALLVFALAAGPTMASPVLAHPQLVRLGDASYSFYMLQWPVVLFVHRFGPQPPTWWFSAAAVLILVAASLATLRWFEMPARHWLRGDQARVVYDSDPSITRATAPSVRSG